MSEESAILKTERAVKTQLTAGKMVGSIGVFAALAGLAWNVWMPLLTGQGRDDQARQAAVATEERVNQSLRRIWDRIGIDEDKMATKADVHELKEDLRHEMELEFKTKR